YTLHARIDQPAERVELKRVELLQRLANDWQIMVRIGFCVAMAGEVLRTCHYSVILQTIHVCDSQACNQPFVFAEGSGINNRVVWIVIYINNRSNVHMDPEPVTLTSDCGTKSVSN